MQVVVRIGLPGHVAEEWQHIVPVGDPKKVATWRARWDAKYVNGDKAGGRQSTPPLLAGVVARPSLSASHWDIVRDRIGDIVQF